MDKRYQIFVSSTFEDLKEERKKIIEEILNFSHIPAGMEMFTASNDEQFEYIKKIIQDCDYYVLIVGGRYGTINPTTGISYTEQEYNYAIDLGIPVLAFVHETPFDLPSIKRDDKNRDEFETFLKKVKIGRMVKYWNNIDRLIADVIISLNHAFRNNPQPGWIRGGEYSDTGLLKQINDLRMEKEKLTEENNVLKTKIFEDELKVNNLAGMDEIYTVSGYTYSYDDLVPYQEEYTWDSIFFLVGPYLYSSCNYEQFHKAIENAFSNFQSVDNNIGQMIKIQLIAQGLLNTFTEKTDSGRLHEFLILSEKGKRYLLENKTIKAIKT